MSIKLDTSNCSNIKIDTDDCFMVYVDNDIVWSQTRSNTFTAKKATLTTNSMTRNKYSVSASVGGSYSGTWYTNDIVAYVKSNTTVKFKPDSAIQTGFKEVYSYTWGGNNITGPKTDCCFVNFELGTDGYLRVKELRSPPAILGTFDSAKTVDSFTFSNHAATFNLSFNYTVSSIKG